jgi:hypothetical protein
LVAVGLVIVNNFCFSWRTGSDVPLEDLRGEGGSYFFFDTDSTIASGASFDALEGVVGLNETHVLRDECGLLLDKEGEYNDVLLLITNLQLAAFHL